MLAFMSVTGYVGMVNIQGLALELVAPDEVYAGLVASFVLRITNTKRYLPSFLLDICYGDATTTLSWLGSKASAETTLSLTFAERGQASIEAMQVRSPFPVNFFVRSWRLPVSCTCIVFPRMLPCVRTGTGDEGGVLDQGSLDQRGVGGDLERILDYSGREPLKQIHWKLSARSGEFKVKEFAQPVAEPLLIDLAELSGQLEERISCAAWLIRQWGLQRAVGLNVDGALIAPLQGRRQIRLLLTVLALHGKA